MKKLILKRPFFLTVSLFTSIAVLLRFIQLGSNIEAQTGFYISTADTGRYIFIAVLILCFLFGPLFLRISKTRGTLPVNRKFDLSGFFSERIVFAIVTVGIAFNTFYEMFRLSHPISNFMTAKNITLFSVLTAITSALCLIFFIIVSFLIDNSKIVSSGFCVVLVIWTIFRVLRDFISFPVILPVSKNLLDVLFLCSLVAVSFSACRLTADADQPKGIAFFTVFAPICISLGFVISVPTILGYICGFELVNESDIFMHLADLALSVFLMRFSMHLYKEQ